MQSGLAPLVCQRGLFLRCHYAVQRIVAVAVVPRCYLQQDFHAPPIRLALVLARAHGAANYVARTGSIGPTFQA